MDIIIKTDDNNVGKDVENPDPRTSLERLENGVSAWETIYLLPRSLTTDF